MSADVVVDERGSRCPMPVIALGRAASAGGPGTTIRLLADDPAADADVPAWCRLKGAALVSCEPADGGGTAYVVRVD